MGKQMDLLALDVRIARALGHEVTEVVMYDVTEIREEYDGRSYELRRYSSDLNLVAGLPLDDAYHWNIKVYLDGITTAKIVANGWEEKRPPEATANTEAEARARVWLAWREAQGDKS